MKRSGLPRFRWSLAMTPFLFASLLFLSACQATGSKDIPEHRISVLADPERGGQLVAVPKPCPDWKYHEMEDLDNEFTAQFNCAQQYNLGMMIADPKDLLQGRMPSASDANPGVLGIERYRTDKKKELINPKEIGSTEK